MKKYLSLLLMSSLALTACNDQIHVSGYTDDVPRLTPDYADVTIPYNIAPLCFGVEGMDETALIVAGQTDSICLTAHHGCFNPDVKAWRQLLSQERGRSLRLTVCRKSEGGWQAMKPVMLHVSADAIDPYLVYRRITPGYGLWNRMGIYQRNLEDYDEEALYENNEGRGNCVNCHSFCNGNPDRWQVHVRYREAGTYILDGREQHKLQLEDTSHGKPVYANWHPNGQLVAYSTNQTFFLIHTTHQNRWEVMDDRSDVMVSDVESGQSYRSPLTAGEGSLETWPCFSPDGRWLYFCSADLTDISDSGRQDVITHFDSLRYNICRIAFDATSRSFGQQVDTLFNARVEGASASTPRISPDGRWLCFTRQAYGNFGICHRDAELCMISLEADSSQAQSSASAQAESRISALDAANDAQHVDSWHSWSHNSRWLVFSSKRDDGIYTRPYLVHIAPDGQASKAFVLPRRDAPTAYDLQMDCYNIPELVSGKIRTHLKTWGDNRAEIGSGVN